MKRSLGLPCAFVLLFGLGCGGDSSSSPSPIAGRYEGTASSAIATMEDYTQVYRDGVATAIVSDTGRLVVNVNYNTESGAPAVDTISAKISKTGEVERATVSRSIAGVLQPQDPALRNGTAELAASFVALSGTLMFPLPNDGRIRVDLNLYRASNP